MIAWQVFVLSFAKRTGSTDIFLGHCHQLRRTFQPIFYVQYTVMFFSECTLVDYLLLFNVQTMFPDIEDAEINSRLVGYCSDQVGEEGFIQKNRQRSSLPVGGQNLFNSLRRQLLCTRTIEGTATDWLEAQQPIGCGTVTDWLEAHQPIDCRDCHRLVGGTATD